MKFQNRMFKHGIGFVSLAICLALTGYGDGLSGTKYADKGGKTTIEFASDHRAYLTTSRGMLGPSATTLTVEVDYSIDGDKIILDTHGFLGRLVVKQASDGTITGFPEAGPLTKAS